MHRILLLLFGICVLAGWQAPAWASGDAGCAPSWKLTHRDFTDCDNMAMLAPSNDSRINLMLLLTDARASTSNGLTRIGDRSITPFLEPAGLDDGAASQAGAPDDSTYSDGEGSRCRSNPSGIASFVAAIARDRDVSPRDRDLLVAARRGLQPHCEGEGAAPPSIAALASVMASAPGKAFAAYLEGAAAFYASDYATAAARFTALLKAKDPWLRETARYMLARVEVNRAQEGYYDEYGSPRADMTIDPKVLARAETALRDDMKAYPNGAYFNSARGLIRRVHWLARDWHALAADYSALIRMPPATRGIADAALMQEIDTKLPYAVSLDAVTSPAILATLDLMRMRVGDGQTVQSASALEAQRPRFSDDPALFDYLLAVRAYYVDKHPAEVLRLIPDGSHQQAFTSIAFSRQFLRGLALEAMRDRNARGFWIDLLPGATRPYQRPAIELALALHDERAGALAGLFAQGSPIRTPGIREILLANIADAGLLRQQANAADAPRHEREVALFTLLFKEATRGSHRDFLTDLALAPKAAPTGGTFYAPVEMEPVPVGVFNRGKAAGDYHCPALRDSEALLAAHPGNSHGLLCVGDFVRVNGFDFTPLGARPKADELGGTRSLFPGGIYSRLDDYRTIIAAPEAPADDKAYALFRAIQCYAPSRINACGGKEAPPAERKAWFFQLKRGHPTSRWAQELEYYW